jgi:hypothetical protein
MSYETGITIALSGFGFAAIGFVAGFFTALMVVKCAANEIANEPATKD